MGCEDNYNYSVEGCRREGKREDKREGGSGDICERDLDGRGGEKWRGYKRVRCGRMGGGAKTEIGLVVNWHNGHLHAHCGSGCIRRGCW